MSCHSSISIIINWRSRDTIVHYYHVGGQENGGKWTPKGLFKDAHYWCWRAFICSMCKDLRVTMMRNYIYCRVLSEWIAQYPILSHNNIVSCVDLIIFAMYTIHERAPCIYYSLAVLWYREQIMRCKWLNWVLNRTPLMPFNRDWQFYFCMLIRQINWIRGFQEIYVSVFTRLI